MHERAFVLYPLKELDKNWIHPISGKSVSQLINELPVGVIRKYPKKLFFFKYFIPLVDNIIHLFYHLYCLTFNLRLTWLE